MTHRISSPARPQAVDPSGQNPATPASQKAQEPSAPSPLDTFERDASAGRNRILGNDETLVDRLLESKVLRTARNAIVRASREASDVQSLAPGKQNFEHLDPEFIIFGDSGTGKDAQYRVAKGMERFNENNESHFAVMLGDNFYTFGVRSPTSSAWDKKFEKPYENIPYVHFPSLGNHDHWGSTSAQVKRSALSDKWHMPAQYYSYRVGTGDRATDFFAIDSEVFDSKQRAWLEEQLASSDAKWKVVYGHHPVFSGGEHGDTKEMKEELLPLLKKYGVDVYLAGHDHHLEVINDEGLLFAVSGSSAKLRTVEDPSRSEFAAAEHGFMHMDVQADGIRLRVLNEDGETLYERTLSKQDIQNDVPPAVQEAA